MLRGTAEEFEYHERRAEQEAARAESCDEVAAEAHRSLADFHRTRAALVGALLEKPVSAPSRAFFGTDKEA